ncbi:MAG: agmatine/peptidylarginine deiminase [Acidimicrobiia bacterium]
MPDLRMPGEFEPHERTLMSWPCRTSLWGPHLDEAEAVYAEIASTIAGFEPVTMFAPAQLAERAAARCGPGVDVVEMPLDDSWLRDNGPTYVHDAEGLLALDFRFNAWGEKFPPWNDDDAFPRRWTERTGQRRREVDLVLEGGSINTDGDGTLVTTAQCLLHPNRNPSMTRTAIDEALRRELGVETVLWLPNGLALDDHTDGHVDNVAAFIEPGRLLLQGCSDPAEEDHERMAANRAVAASATDGRGRRLEIVDVPVLPFTEFHGEHLVVPYLNLYIVNGGVIVPTCGHPADADVLALIGDCFPGRTVVPVPAAVVAYGGGGPHCITQQVPAAP